MKVDAQIVEECRRTIFHLQGYSYPNLYCKVLSNHINLRRIQLVLCWMRGEIKEPLFIKLRSICAFLFETGVLTKDNNIAYTKNSQEFLSSQVSVLSRNKATNVSSFNHPFSRCNKNLCFANLFKRLTLFISGRGFLQTRTESLFMCFFGWEKIGG